ALREHREQQRDPLWVDAIHRPARKAEARGRDQGLHLDEERTRAFDRRDDDAARDAAAALLEEHLRRVHDLSEAALPHLEHADFVRRTEPVLRTAKDPERMEPFALEIEDRVDDVLEDARTCDIALLGHVTDEEDRNVVAL